ncbi:MAG TPA: hypothetical protein VF367_03700 [Candidatus Limnocylindria bacterium]
MKRYFLALAIAAAAWLLTLAEPPDRYQSALVVFGAFLAVVAFGPYMALARGQGTLQLPKSVTAASLAVLWILAVAWAAPVYEELYQPVGDGRCTFLDNGAPHPDDGDCFATDGSL